MPHLRLLLLSGLLLAACVGAPPDEDDDDDDGWGAADDSAVSADDTGAGDDTGVPRDTSLPTIEHRPVSGPLPVDEAVALEADIIDRGSGVQEAWIHYLPPGASVWERAAMVGEEEDRYTGTIPASAVRPDGLNYYLEALDAAGNRSTMPANGAVNAFYIRVTAD